MTSAPNGCCELRIDRTAFGSPVSRSSSVATTVVVPRSKAIAWRLPLVSPCFHVDEHVVDDDGGHLPVRATQRAAELAHDVERDAQLEVVHRGEQPFEIRLLVLERRLDELDVALLHRGPEDDVAPDADERGLRSRLQRRHLDRQVLERVRAAREAPAALQLLDGERARIDRADRRVPGDDLDLALLARAVAAAR